jgi:hypothetical protein
MRAGCGDREDGPAGWRLDRAWRRPGQDDAFGRNAQSGGCHPGRRGAKYVNVNLLRSFSEPATLDSEARGLLQRGMALAMEWATQGLVVPHVSQTIDSTVEAINAGLQSLRAGRGGLGKIAVDRG